MKFAILVHVFKRQRGGVNQPDVDIFRRSNRILREFESEEKLAEAVDLANTGSLLVAMGLGEHVRVIQITRID
ncbi:MAG: hypothetical protein Q7S12_04665 [bacterium]|nr:hypothetical protein [bacterium]